MELAPILQTDAIAGLTTVNSFITETNSTISDLFTGTTEQKTAAKNKLVSILKSASNDFESKIGYEVIAKTSDETKTFQAQDTSRNWIFPIPILSVSSSSITLKGNKPLEEFTITGKFGLTSATDAQEYLQESDIRSAVNAIAYKRFRKSIRSQSLGQDTETFTGMSWVDTLPPIIIRKNRRAYTNITEVKTYD